MQSQPATIVGNPPRLFNSVVAGFNTVAGNIQLILIPLALDLFLWFGPHLSIKQLLQPLFEEWVNTVNLAGSQDMRILAEQSRPVFQATIDHFNLFSVIRTWPVGVPSLVAPLGYAASPLGAAPLSEITSLDSAFLAWFAILLVGMALGALFFGSVAFYTADRPVSASLHRAFWGISQTLALTALLVVALVLIAIPLSLVLTILSLLNVAFAQFAVLLITFFLLWALLPLVFAPHGIFSYGFSAITSLLTSMRLVRRYLPGTGMFLVVLIVFSEGLNFIWQAAPENSWMLLVGIAGHAFINTALLAASFIYYQGGMRWMQENLQQAAPAPRQV
jgi:hypothetical protein